MIKNKVLVTKISANPSRSVNLGELKGWATLSAGVEVKLDPPLKLGSKELGEIWGQVRQEITEEFKRQWEPYKPKTKLSPSSETSIARS